MLTNIATKTGANEADPDTSNDSSSATVNAGTLADVGLLKTVDNPNPKLGDMVTFTVTATNYGPSPASNVVVTDVPQPPGGLGFVSAIPSQGTFDLGTGEWTIGDLDVGDVVTLTLVAKVNQTGPIVNAVAKTQAETTPDPNPANDRASVTLNGPGPPIWPSQRRSATPRRPWCARDLHRDAHQPRSLDVDGRGGVRRSSSGPDLRLPCDSVAGNVPREKNQWTVGDLPATQSAVPHHRDAESAGTFTNVARASGRLPIRRRSNPTNDSGSATGMAGLVADLEITKTTTSILRSPASSLPTSSWSPTTARARSPTLT